jgi:hypothetical protein
MPKRPRNTKNGTCYYIFLHNLVPDFFEDDIVIGDESWFHDCTPETKIQSMQ